MHPYSWQTSHRADGGRVRLVSTPKSPTLWILVYSRILQVGTCLIMQTEEGLASYQRPHTQKKWKFGSRCCHTHWFSDFAFRAQLKGQDYVDPCELTHVATFTSRSTHAHVRLFLLCGRSTWVYCRPLYILDKHCKVRSHGFNLAHCLSRLARNPRFQGAVSWASLCPAGIAHSD